VAAPVRKCREATEAAQTGWSLTTQFFGMHSRNVACERPPRPLQMRWLRILFLHVASTPPLWGLLLSDVGGRDFRARNSVFI